MTIATTALRMLFVSDSAVLESPRTPPAPLFSIASRARLDDLVVALQEAQLAPSAREVVDVARYRVGEVVHLLHERGHERRSDPHDDQDRADEHDPDRGAAANPRRTRNSTAGLRAIARKSAISTQMITDRVTQSTSSTIATPRMTPITLRIARGRNRISVLVAHPASIGRRLDDPGCVSRL